MLPSDRLERWLWIGALFLGVAVIGLRLAVPQLEATDWPFLDAYSKASTDVAPSTDSLTLVLIDDDGLVRMGERWPLSRKTWARFLRVVAPHKPAAVALDAWFETPSPRSAADLALDIADQISSLEFGDTPQGMDMTGGLEKMASTLDGDRQFSAALADLGKVVLGMVCADGRRDIDIAKNALPRPLAVQPEAVESVMACEKLAASIAPLAVAAHSQAGLMVPPDRDGKIRKYPLIFRKGEEFYPSLALATAMAARPDEANAFLERAVKSQTPRPILRFQATDGFRVLRFGDILEAEKDSPGLKKGIEGKILVVGVSAQGTEDLVRTSVHGNIPGVLIHASAIAGILENSFILNYPGGIRLGALLGVMVLLLLAWMVRNPQGGGVVVMKGLMMAGLWIGIATYAASRSVLFPTGTVLLGMGCVTLGGVGIIFLRGQSARLRARAIRRAFAFYLSPTVVEELISDPTKLKLGGSRREITAFFSDVKGFTSISEQMNPADLVKLLNECLGVMTEIILEEGGTVDKYIGDAVVAMFGAPVEHKDHALRACRAAIRCQEALTELRKQWLARGWPEIRVRIGLNTGVAIVGNMGSQQRFDYTMIGDAVNQAARFEGVNKVYKTWVLASHSTLEACRDDILARELDTVLVRGKAEGVRIYEPMAIRGDETSEQRAVCDRFGEGLEAWRSRRWNVAEEIFKELAARGDGPASEFVSRLEEIKNEQPQEDWDGVYVMKKK